MHPALTGVRTSEFISDRICNPLGSSFYFSVFFRSI
uniref:Uncharacterized protein n=1 Tax=Arundo donax TaxID=35708 RepID=A0A0A9DXJ6_ARUDO